MSERYSAVPLSPLRKVIAARMTEAVQTIPHFRLVGDIEMGAMLALREQQNAAHAVKVSINDCIVKACALALIEHPDVNAQLVDGVLHRYLDADISVVIATREGLVTPVVRSANSKTVAEIAAETRTLVTRAAARQLRMDELVGGSFTVSNLGAYGVDQFDAIINAPQCAILAVGRVREQVLAAPGGTRVATVMRATLSVDHRAIDGALGAAFFSTLRRVLEYPQNIFARTG